MSFGTLWRVKPGRRGRDRRSTDARAQELERFRRENERLRQELANAVSIAGMLMLAEATLTEIPEPSKAGAADVEGP
jgi:hypothetical protein